MIQMIMSIKMTALAVAAVVVVPEEAAVVVLAAIGAVIRTMRVCSAIT